MLRLAGVGFTVRSCTSHLRHQISALGINAFFRLAQRVEPPSPLTILITNMPKDPIYKGLVDVLGGIPLDSIQPRDGITTKVDLTTLTSYNLLPKQRKSIVVPGT